MAQMELLLREQTIQYENTLEAMRVHTEEQQDLLSRRSRLEADLLSITRQGDHVAPSMGIQDAFERACDAMETFALALQRREGISYLPRLRLDRVCSMAGAVGTPTSKLSERIAVDCGKLNTVLLQQETL